MKLYQDIRSLNTVLKFTSIFGVNPPLDFEKFRVNPSFFHRYKAFPIMILVVGLFTYFYMKVNVNVDDSQIYGNIIADIAKVGTIIIYVITVVHNNIFTTAAWNHLLKSFMKIDAHLQSLKYFTTTGKESLRLFLQFMLLNLLYFVGHFWIFYQSLTGENSISFQFYTITVVIMYVLITTGMVIIVFLQCFKARFVDLKLLLKDILKGKEDSKKIYKLVVLKKTYFYLIEAVRSFNSIFGLFLLCYIFLTSASILNICYILAIASKSEKYQVPHASMMMSNIVYEIAVNVIKTRIFSTLSFNKI